MAEDWGYGDEPQLTLGWALALVNYVGWKRRRYMIQAVSLMWAESARYPEAWHLNYPGSAQESKDYGLFQINDKWHQDFDTGDGFQPIYNAQYAHQMWKDHGKTFGGSSGWAAYGGVRYLAYYPVVAAAHLLGRWRNKLPHVEKHF